MIRTEGIVATVSECLGLEAKDVSLIVRRLRESGTEHGIEYWVRETRSANSPVPSPRHVAHLLIAILSGEPAIHAKRAVDRAYNCHIGFDGVQVTWNDVSRQLPYKDIWNLLRNQPCAELIHILAQPLNNFAEAVYKIIEFSIKNPDSLYQIYFSDISLDIRPFIGNIILSNERLPDSSVIDGRFNINFGFMNLDHLSTCRGGLTEMRLIPLSFIIQIAEKMRGATPPPATEKKP